MGALAGTATGIMFRSSPLHLPLTILAGFLGGALGFDRGALKVRFGASEIITTVMLNDCHQLYRLYG